MNEAHQVTRIAVPSNDGVHIAPHTGRARTFIIFDVVNKTVIATETRESTHAHEHQDHSQENEPGAPHDHAGLARCLRDCQVVLCRRIGERARATLTGWGIEVVSTDEEFPAKEAVEAFLSGRLISRPTSCDCGCRQSMKKQPGRLNLNLNS